MALYIPPKVKAGLINRQDTFDGKLGYIIPSEKSGNKYRQEDGWNEWLNRNGRQGVFEYENKPRRGYFINKSIKRISYSSFGSKVEKLRIYDDRGFEFEIDMMNVALLAQSCDISKGEIMQECVFAWSGKNIVLLPTSSSEYMELVEAQEKLKQHKEIMKTVDNVEFVVGNIYNYINGKKKTDTEKYIYLGYGVVDDNAAEMKYVKRPDLFLEDNKWMANLKKREGHFFVRLYDEGEDSYYRDGRYYIYEKRLIDCETNHKMMEDTGENINDDKFKSTSKSEFLYTPLNGLMKQIAPVDGVKHKSVPLNVLSENRKSAEVFFHSNTGKFISTLKENKAKGVLITASLLVPNNNGPVCVIDLVDVSLKIEKDEDRPFNGYYMDFMYELTVKNVRTGVVKTYKEKINCGSYQQSSLEQSLCKKAGIYNFYEKALQKTKEFIPEDELLKKLP